MIHVVAAREGRVVTDFPVEHGVDPEAVLAARGWHPVAVTVEGESPDLLLRYAVEAGPVRPLPPTEPRREPSRQRIAAYVAVVSEGRLLLTEGSWEVPGGRDWLLPGGGVDPGERITDAVVRETWEETGQHLEDVELVTVSTTRRVGPGPVKGLAHDFHAVRLIHRASCPTPTTPVVHDVGGSTASAHWVPLDELVHLRLLPWVMPAIGHLLAP